MPILIGLGVALALAAFARLSGLDRDRAFYPVVLIVVGHYYILFAVVAGGGGLSAELGFFALFAALAVLGFRWSLWLAAAGLVLHGLFDFTRPLLIAGRGVPVWWPGFCAGFDLAAGAVLAVLLLSGGRDSGSSRPG